MTKVRRFWYVVLISLVVFILQTSLAADKQALSEKIDEIVQAEAGYDLFSGALLVAEGGEVIYSGAFGFANKDHGVPNKPTTKFNIGSIGKVFTATLTMQLVQDGKIALTDPLSKYLPDCPYPEKDRIQVRHLLNHSSGLANYMEHEDYEASKVKLRQISDVLPMIYDQEVLFEPGQDHRYSNSAMVVMGAVIEKVTGMGYRDFLKQQILDPLGMEDTDLIYTEDVVRNRATGYTRLGHATYRADILGEPPAFSDGGIYSTVLDMFKFDQALYGDELLEEKYKQTMFTPEGPDRYAGYGWGVVTWGGTTVLMHSGGCPGFNADFRRYPEKGYTIIVLSNYYGGAFEMTNAIEALLLGMEYSVASEVTFDYREGLHQQRHEDYVKAAEHFERNTKGDKPHLPSLYQLARTRILGKFELEKAIAELDWYMSLSNEQTQPSIAAAWWRKGVAFEGLGKRDTAIQCYRKSLDLDPDFEEARESLTHLEAAE
jgi:CubicO group peptidase (beta-lactamase class C family)